MSTLTESEKITISQILEITPTFLDSQIAALGISLTTARETAIRAEIAKWDAGAGFDFVKIHPRESNFGVETFANETSGQIRRNIAVLLELCDSAAANNSIGTIEICR